MVSHYFHLAVPLKKAKNVNKNKGKWITQGIGISSEKLKILYLLVQNGDGELKTYYSDT